MNDKEKAEVVNVIGRVTRDLVNLGFQGVMLAAHGKGDAENETQIMATVLGSWSPVEASRCMQQLLQGFTNVFEDIMVKESVDDVLREMGIDPGVTDDPDIIPREGKKPLRFIHGNEAHEPEAADILKQYLTDLDWD